jgi:hypothetical protein
MKLTNSRTSDVMKLVDILEDVSHGYLAFVFELLDLNLDELLHERKNRLMRNQRYC